MRNRASCVKVELPCSNLTKGDHIPRESEYHKGHEVSSIPNEVRREIRRRAQPPRGSEAFLFLPHVLLSGRFCKAVRRPQSPPPPLALPCGVCCPICLTSLHCGRRLIPPSEFLPPWELPQVLRRRCWPSRRPCPRRF